MPLADDEDRERERLRHIARLREYVNDPNNPRRKTHLDELNKALQAQRVYEDSKRRGTAGQHARQEPAGQALLHPSLPRVRVRGSTHL